MEVKQSRQTRETRRVECGSNTIFCNASNTNIRLAMVSMSTVHNRVLTCCAKKLGLEKIALIYVQLIRSFARFTSLNILF